MGIVYFFKPEININQVHTLDQLTQLEYTGQTLVRAVNNENHLELLKDEGLSTE